MKRVRNSDINFKVNPKLVNLKDFTMKFYTVNSQFYYFSKNEDDIVEVEREATIYDEDVIASGGTTVKEYFLKLDWSELKNIGEGVLSWKAINNTKDMDYPDYWYNRMVERTTEYYIDSDIKVNPSEDKNLLERITELDTRLGIEGVERTEADEYISGVVDSYIESNDAALANEIARALSAETDLNLAILTEKNRATTRESELTDLISGLRQDLTDESEIRSSADTAIWTSINNEVLRAVSAETVLDNKIDSYIVSNNEALANEVLRATSAETKIANDLAAEITRSSNEESRIETKLDNEVSRATAKESEILATIASNYSGLTTAIADEETRAKGQETALNENIQYVSGVVDSYIVNNNKALNDEIVRASSAETKIANDLANYIASNNHALSDEVNRATEKENIISGRLESYIATNDTALANEVSRATEKENALSGKIDSYIVSNNAALQAEITRATSAETKIATDLANYISTNDHLLNDEVSRATSRENAIEIKLDNYIASNNSGVTELSTALQAEVNRATAKELELSGYVDTRVEQIISGAPAALDTLLEIAEKLADDDDAIAAIINDITSETSARTAADTNIQTALDAEILRATGSENSITNSLNNEVLRATSAETQISSNLTSEINRATAAENALDTRIDNLVSGTTDSINNEISRAKAQENAISGKLDTYIASNDNVITNINSSISDEVARATAAETANTKAISDEVSRATAKETAIETKVDNYITSNNQALANETLRATSAESALSARIDVLTAITDVIHAETVRASQSETVLSGMIESLSSSTSGDITDLETALANEVSRATNKENEITATVASNYSTLSAAINDEETRAEGVENALSGAIDTKLAINDFNTYSAATDSKIEYLSGAVSSNTTAINAERDRAISAETEIISTIDDNELATSEAINDLNSRVINIVDNTYSKTEVDDLVNSGATVTALIQRIAELENYIDKLKENNVDKLTLEYNEQTGDYYIGGGDYA